MTETTSPTSPTPAWGRTQGFLDFGSPAAALTADQVADRALLIEAVNRYTWSYDERDLPAMSTVFTRDAVFDGDVAGTFPIGPYNGLDAIAQWLQGHMDNQPEQRRHNAINHVVTRQDQDTAQVVTTLLLTAAANGQVRMVTTGFYRIDLVKSEVGWRISHIFGGFDTAF